MNESYLFWVSLAQTIGKFAFATTTISGLVLIFFNLFGVKKMFGTYKYLMSIFTGLGIYLATLEVIFHPNLHFYNIGYVYFSLSQPFNLNQHILTHFLGLYAGVYCLTISLLAVQFIYRYWAVFCLKNMKYFQGWRSLIWVVYCIFFAIQWHVGVYKLLEPDTVTNDYFREELLKRYSVVSKELPLRAFMAYDPVDRSVRLWNCTFAFVVIAIMSFQYGIMIYCGWAMYSKMEEKIRNFSSALKHHHKQLFTTLIFQITTPTIFLFSPLVLVIYLPFFDIELSFPAGATVCAFNFYPALDVFIVLFVVTEYRVAARRLWNSFLKHTVWVDESKTKSQGETTFKMITLTV